ncbi:MAG: hypothetical protein OXN16_14860 [Gammaproteobacteria bacterium]|nr:hypothetical protein [Gammaproteobacteria bacterium]
MGGFGINGSQSAFRTEELGRTRTFGLKNFAEPHRVGQYTPARFQFFSVFPGGPDCVCSVVNGCLNSIPSDGFALGPVEYPRDHSGQSDDVVDGDYLGQSGIFFRHETDIAGLLAGCHIPIGEIGRNQSQQTRVHNFCSLVGRPQDWFQDYRAAAITGVNGRIDQEIFRPVIVPVLYAGNDAMADDDIVLGRPGNAQWKPQDENLVAFVALAGGKVLAGNCMPVQQEEPIGLKRFWDLNRIQWQDRQVDVLIRVENPGAGVGICRGDVEWRGFLVRQRGTETDPEMAPGMNDMPVRDDEGVIVLFPGW